MAKNVDVDVIEEGTEKVAVESGITKLDMNLYREDLNALVAKINELIDVVNN